MTTDSVNTGDRTTHLDHMDPSVPEDELRALFTDMRESCPVAHTDNYGGYDYISRYSDVRSILAGSETYTSGDGVFIPPPGLPRIPALEYDPPEHTTLRKLMYNQLLTPRAVRAFEPKISEDANRLIDAFADRGSADLAPEFAELLPAIVVGRIVGLDFDEAVEMRRIAITMFDSIGTPDFPANLDVFIGFQQEQLESRRANPRDDYLTMLANGEVDGVPIDDQGVTGVMTAFLLGAHHSTATGIGGLLGHVLSEPGVQEQVLNDPDALPRVVEESLRLTTPLPFFARTVQDSVTLSGVDFEEGARVMVNLAAANRDGRQFADPEQFDAHRQRNPHLAFGSGLHVCMGQHLARAEMRLAVVEIFKRLPDIRLSGEILKAGMQGGMLIPVVSVPVEFTPQGARS